MNILLDEKTIHARIAEMAGAISDDYQDTALTIIGVLTGSLLFVADLVRLLNLSLRIGFIQASSYRGNTTEPGKIEIVPQILPEIRDQHVLLVDDILDTGQTLDHLLGHLKTLQPTSLRTAVLLRKKARQKIPIEPDYCGFDIPDKFVIGYGLDYNDQYRHLPYIAEYCGQQ